MSPVSVYTYDESDNPTKLDTHQVTYEWDDFNKLVAVSASLNASPAAEPKQQNAYSVNGFRRQKVKKDGQVVTEYAEGLATAVAKTQAETVTYIHGHQILGFEKGGDFFYFVTDALGSVRDIVNSSGTVVQQYEFDERGNHLISPMGGGPASPKTFVGGLSVNDDTGDSGLYLMGHRFYDPSLGRFLNRDPIGFAGGLNLFSYGGNNPVTRVDPEGLNDDAPDVIARVSQVRAFKKNILVDVTVRYVSPPTNVGDMSLLASGVTIRLGVEARIMPRGNNTKEVWIANPDCPNQVWNSGPLIANKDKTRTFWLKTPFDSEGKIEFFDRYKIHVTMDSLNPMAEKVVDVGGMFQLRDTIELHFSAPYRTIDPNYQRGTPSNN